MKRDPYLTAVRWTLALCVLWFFVRPAMAGPPLHGPLPCDPACVHYHCTAMCSTGRHGDAECYAECVRRESNDCETCREPAPRPKTPAGRPAPTP